MAAASSEKISEVNIRNVISNLKKTFIGQFNSKWSNIARQLNVPSEEIKKLRVNIKLGTIVYEDVLEEILENWVGRCSNDATISALATAFEDNGLKKCADSLRETFCKNKYRSYCQIPSELKDFLSRDAKTICIIYTPDTEITCKKIAENHGNCSFHLPDMILQQITHPTRNMEQLYVVKNCSIKKMIDENICSILLQKDLVCPKLVIVAAIQEKNDGWKFVNCDRVRKIRIQVCEDTMTWDDLSPPHKSEIAKKMEEMFQFHWESEILNKILNGEVLVELINNERIKLFKQTVPEELSSYLDCNLSTRNVVSGDILSNKCSDVFLIVGIEKYVLGLIAFDQLTDTAANQVQRLDISVRILLLEEQDTHHFSEICERTQAHVHVLHYENEELVWKKSRGSIRIIQTFLQEKQVSLSEKTFFEKLPSENNFPICISGCSGTGMAVFLARAGQILSGMTKTDAKDWIDPNNFQNRTVIFTTVKGFIANLKKQEGTETGPSKLAILKTLENLICQNELDRYILESKLKTKGVSFEILLDSFDEVDSLNLHFAYRAFQKIISFKSIRLWVTCRMHFLGELENRLRVLSYRLDLFCMIHPKPSRDCVRAVKYLTLYWKQYIKNLDNATKSIDEKQVEKYATACFSSYVDSAQHTDTEKDGIFLKYFQLAKLHEHKAANIGSDDQQTPLHVSSNLFKALIDNRIENYQLNPNNIFYDKRTLMDMHVTLSLKCLFPTSLVVKSEGPLPAVPYNDVVKVGLLNQEFNEEAPTFIHISFAEYFVVWFIIKELLGCPNSFQTCSTDRGIWKISLLPRLQICYIIESLLLSKQYIIPCHLIKFKVFDKKRKLQKIAQTCAEKIFVNIFKLLKNVNAFSKHEESVFNRKLLIATVKKACFEFVNVVLMDYNRLTKDVDDINFKIGLLSLSVARGNYEMVELFIKTNEAEKKALISLVCDNDINNQKNNLKYLLHDCIRNTKNNTTEKIDQRRKIVYLLVYLNYNLLEIKDEQGNKATESSTVHAELDKTITKIKKDRLSGSWKF